jgi:hypothetical protein
VDNWQKAGDDLQKAWDTTADQLIKIAAVFEPLTRIAE